MHWQFYCSWPAGALTHSNEGVRMRANREQRNEAYLLACRAIPTEAIKRLQNQSQVKLKLQLIRPNKGAWIESEIAERCESLIQGIANALCTNRFQTEFTMEDPPVKPGGVRVTVTELEFSKSSP